MHNIQSFTRRVLTHSVIVAGAVVGAAAVMMGAAAFFPAEVGLAVGALGYAGVVGGAGYLGYRLSKHERWANASNKLTGFVGTSFLRGVTVAAAVVLGVAAVAVAASFAAPVVGAALFTVGTAGYFGGVAYAAHKLASHSQVS